MLASLIRGHGAEHLRGNMEEAHDRRLRGGQRGVGWSYLHDAIRSLFLWYRPGEVSRRRKRGGAAKGSSPGRPGKGRGMEGWISDFRYAFRGLRKRPAFAVLVLLTLGLGIGATTTIFSVVDSVMLRPLPYDDPGRIVTLGNIFPGREWSDQVEGLQRLAGVSYLNFAEVRERIRSLRRSRCCRYRR